MREETRFRETKYGLIFRSAASSDSARQIASLIYQTDPYIYPYWIPDKRDFANLMTQLLDEPNHIFNRQNSYVVHMVKENYVLGLMTLLHSKQTLHAEVDDHLLKKYPNHHAEVTKKYFQKILDQHQALEDNEAILLNFCIIPGFRRKLIGTTFLEIVFRRLQDNRIRKVYFNCLAGNETALRLYKRAGCQIVSEGLGFGGDQAQPKIFQLEKTFQ